MIGSDEQQREKMEAVKETEKWCATRQEDSE